MVRQRGLTPGSAGPEPDRSAPGNGKAGPRALDPIAARSSDGRTTHVPVVGPLDRAAAARLQERLAALPGGCSGTMVLDLCAADYADSDGIRWLRRLQDELAARGGALRLQVRRGSRVERTLDLLRLEGTIPIERLDEANASPVPVGKERTASPS